MFKNYLRFNDAFNIEPNSLKAIQDNLFQPQIARMSSTLGMDEKTLGALPSGLLVRIIATHSGMIINNRVYLPDKMKKGSSTFLDKYPKPILIGHPDHGLFSAGAETDPVGRVVAAEYIDTSKEVFTLDSKLFTTDSVISQEKFQDFIDGKIPYIDQVALVRDVLGPTLFEKEKYQGLGHIQLLLNITDPEAIQKVKDGRYLTGSISAITDSAVCSICKVDWLSEDRCEHVPGQKYDEKRCYLITGNLEYDHWAFVNQPADADSQVLEIFYNETSNQLNFQNASDSKTVTCDFPQYISQGDPQMEIVLIDSKISPPVAESVVTPAQQILPITAESIIVPTLATGPSLLLSDTPLSPPPPVIIEPLPITTPVVVEDPLDVLLNKVIEKGELTEEESENLYNFMVEGMEDAKLSTAKRKSLPSSSFCGPGRSFPVPDCSHYTAAKRLVGRYKGPGSKETILACVERKGKALGCTKNKDEAIQIPNVIDCKSCTEALEVENKALADEVVRLETLAGTLRDELEAIKIKTKPTFDDNLILQEKLIVDKAQMRQIKEKYFKLLNLLDKGLVDDKVDYAGLNETNLDTEIIKLSDSLDYQKISHKLNNGMSRIPEGTIDNPTGLLEGAEAVITVKKKDLEIYNERYFTILLGRGKEAANLYVKSLVKNGKLPANSINLVGEKQENK